MDDFRLATVFIENEALVGVDGAEGVDGVAAAMPAGTENVVS